MEREFQQQQAKELMQQGVTFADPARFDLRGSVKVGQDVRIDINVIIEGQCELGDGVEIGAGCILKTPNRSRH
jgi:bifunctional UDP-N-acetylglucosamine pyrophosphorylase/glucosamine-1-phosphate N-acetyltransferase